MSVTTDQINAAIAAHAAWKTRLKQAIDTSSSEFDPAVVSTDNQCQFGKWLYQEIDAQLKQDPHYESVRTKHAEFHQMASQVLALALQGQKEEAQKHLDFSSEFMQLSAQLTNELASWKSTLPE